MNRAFIGLVLAMVFLSGLDAQVYINEFCGDPLGSSIALDTNLDGVVPTSSSQSDDEFVEIVNAGPTAVDISGWMLSDLVLLRHVFDTPTSLPPGAAIVVFGGGSVATFNTIGAATGVIASSGSIGLNNGGDTITLADALGAPVDQVVYSGTVGAPPAGNGEASTRDPENPTGTFVLHSTLPAMLLHSAGFLNDGSTPYPPATVGAPAWPGNGADCAIEVAINGLGAGDITEVYNAAGGDLISLSFTSPGQSLIGMNFVAAVAFFPTGTMLGVTSLPGDPTGTGIWLPPSTSFVFIDGVNNLVLTPVIGPGGYVHHSIMPLQLAGTGSSIGIQAAVTAPGQNAFNIGLTNMAEFVVL